jgi:hypothetical protein
MHQAPSAAAAATVPNRKASTDYFGIAYMNFAHVTAL